MPRPDPTPTQLDRDLADLKLLEIAKHYREVLDEAARKGSSMLEVLAMLVGTEQTVRQQRALERRLPGTAAQAEDLGRVRLHLPKANPQDSHRPPFRLRFHSQAWLCRLDWSNRNREVASFNRPRLHSR
jgi:hypothetical protein